MWLLVAVYMDYRMTGAAELASLYSQVAAIHLMLNVLVTCFIIARLKRGRDGGGIDGGPALR